MKISIEERSAILDQRVDELEAAYVELSKQNAELSEENVEARKSADRSARELADAKNKIRELELQVLGLKAKLYDYIIRTMSGTVA